jgi:hypothetical protein
MVIFRYPIYYQGKSVLTHTKKALFCYPGDYSPQVKNERLSCRALFLSLQLVLQDFLILPWSAEAFKRQSIRCYAVVHSGTWSGQASGLRVILQSLGEHPILFHLQLTWCLSWFLGYCFIPQCKTDTCMRQKVQEKSFLDLLARWLLLAFSSIISAKNQHWIRVAKETT